MTEFGFGAWLVYMVKTGLVWLPGCAHEFIDLGEFAILLMVLHSASHALPRWGEGECSICSVGRLGWLFAGLGESFDSQ